MIRKLFISHSSKTEENRALLQQICNGISKQVCDGDSSPSYEVLVDQGGKIRFGEDWEKHLNEWMAECHAAVILFSKAALYDSDWVKKEAAILSWRREIQSDFILIPVLLDDLQPEELEKGLYKTLRVGKSQCVRYGTSVQDIISGITDVLGDLSLPTSTPFSNLEDIIHRLLQERATQEVLAGAWEHIASPHQPRWQPGNKEPFAAVLTRYLLREGRGAIDRLQALLDNIHPRLDKGTCLELLGYVRSLWVDPGAASGLSSNAPGHNKVVALNGNPFLYADFTSQCYVERAWPLSNQWREVRLTTTSRTRDAIEEELFAEFKGPLRRSTKDLARRVSAYKQPILVFFPPPDSGDSPELPDSELLYELRNTYPSLVIVIPVGEELPEHLPEPIQPLLPPLNLETEQTQADAWEDTLNFIERRLHRARI
uniref:TIR domain-containing protein n=1 Tax=Candidatus Kentrum sp. FW TaxID=2126338 RepID=A0A450TWT4_9GAMM|nr:MAG: TIR domain-containing protein [Candidatus Kentron sp. FW]